MAQNTREYQSPQEFKQFLILAFLAPFGFGIFALLAIYDAYYLNSFDQALIPAFVSLAFLTTAILYRTTSDIRIGILLIITSVTLILPFFAYQNQNQGFGLVWAVLYPAFIIMTLGHKWGVKLAVIQLLILNVILIQGIGVWQNGSWGITEILRFSFAYIAMTYMSYVLSLGSHFSYNSIKRAHLSQKHLNKEFEQVAKIDSTTNVYSRYSLNQHTQKLPLEELTENKSCIVFFIVKIENFKEYVDDYGYQQGDETLIAISRVILNQMKPVNGKVYRLTGSEFGGLIISQDITKAMMLIKEIQELINKEEIPHQLYEDNLIHTSIGITIDNQYNDFDFSKLFTKADAAIYQSKENHHGEPCVLDLRLSAKNLKMAS